LIDISFIKLGMTRTEMLSKLGKPTQIGRSSRKHPAPQVYRYGQIEFGFGPKSNDGLFYVMDVGKNGLDHVMLLSSLPY
jgi:hypothetical protein